MAGDPAGGGGGSGSATGPNRRNRTSATMAGDPAGGGGGGGSATGKSPRSSSRHRQFRDRAKTRVDDLQEIFSGLQSARQESRSADAAVLEEQVHQMLREWRAELSVASPASSLQNSLGNSQGAADPPSETLRLLQLAIEEEDDATSKLAIPRSSRLGHGLGQDDQNLNAQLQVQGENVAGGAPVTQQSLGHEVMGDFGREVADVANALFNDQRAMRRKAEMNLDTAGHLQMHGYSPFVVTSSACGEPRPIYGGLYMVGGYGEGYFFPTWVAA